MKETNPTFELNLQSFVKGCQEIINKNHTDQQYTFPVDQLSIDNGSRYAKIIRTARGQTFVYCFVDKTNGDVLKAATFKQPAKGARGNIYCPDNGLTNMTSSGAAYKVRGVSKGVTQQADSPVAFEPIRVALP